MLCHAIIPIFVTSSYTEILYVLWATMTLFLGRSLLPTDSRNQSGFYSTYLIVKNSEIPTGNTLVLIFMTLSDLVIWKPMIGTVLDFIFKRRGTRNDIIQFRSYDYRKERRSSFRNVYCCMQKDKWGCKARLTAQENYIFPKNMDHTHPPSFKKYHVYEKQEVVVMFAEPRKPKRKGKR